MRRDVNIGVGAVLAGGAAAVQVRETGSRLREHGDSLRGCGLERLVRVPSLADPAADASLAAVGGEAGLLRAVRDVE